MRVLVTCGAGIGWHLAARLLAGGYVVPGGLATRVPPRLGAALEGTELEDL